MYPRTIVDINIEIKTKLIQLGLGVVETSEAENPRFYVEPEVLEWCVKTIERDGQFINLVPNVWKLSPERHWYSIRQLMSEEALETLSRKLSEKLELKRCKN